MKKTGRPALPPELKKTPVVITLTDEQKAQFHNLGGSKFVQRILHAIHAETAQAIPSSSTQPRDSQESRDPAEQG